MVATTESKRLCHGQAGACLDTAMHVLHNVGGQDHLLFRKPRPKKLVPRNFGEESKLITENLK